MTRILNIFFLSIALFFVSMLNGMANNGQPENIGACVSQDNSVSDDSHKQQTFSLDDFGLTSELLSAEQSEFSSNGEQEESSNQAKRFSKQCRSLKFHFSSSFFANRATKGVAKHPGTQDPLQQRTETIRFLQLAALVC